MCSSIDVPPGWQPPVPDAFALARTSFTDSKVVSDEAVSVVAPTGELLTFAV